MKNKKSKALTQYTKPELIKIIRGIERDFHSLKIVHNKALKYCASLRYALKIELDDRVNESFWDNHLEDLLEFDEEVLDDVDLPPDKRRIPKREMDGYS
jgi:hypothetical protein